MSDARRDDEDVVTVLRRGEATPQMASSWASPLGLADFGLRLCVVRRRHSYYYASSSAPCLVQKPAQPVCPLISERSVTLVLYADEEILGNERRGSERHAVLPELRWNNT